MVKVSVILTTYNAERTIQRIIDSILNQKGRGKLFNMEIIVIDDCSTDRTPQILHKNNLPFRTTNANSGGPNKGRNMGLKTASGDYICFIDHDDEWEPEKTILQLKSAQYAPIVSTGYRIINTETGKETIRCKSGNEPLLYKQNEAFLNILKKELNGQTVNYSSLMIASDLKDIYFEENFGMVDYDWLLRIFENQKSIEVPKVLVTRYVNNNNLSLHEGYRRKDYYYSLFALESYQEKYPKEVATGIKRINGSRARYFYIIKRMSSARQYFMKSRMEPKTIGYLITSYFGSTLVKRTYNVFG